MPRRKTAYQKLRAKTVKAATKKVKAVKRSVKRTRKKAVKSVRKTAKRVKRTAKRTYKSQRKKITRAYKKRTKSTVRVIRTDALTKERIASEVAGARVLQAGGDKGASKPGEPPKMRTGRGRNSIRAAEVHGKTLLGGKRKPMAKTFVDKRIAKYMAIWEYRKDGKARPFLKPSYRRNRRMLAKLMAAELKKMKRGGKRTAKVT